MNLRQLRDVRSLAQIEVAAACGVSIATVSLWESGTVTPRPQNVRKLAEMYGVSIAEIQEAIRQSANSK